MHFLYPIQKLYVLEERCSCMFCSPLSIICIFPDQQCAKRYNRGILRRRSVGLFWLAIHVWEVRHESMVENHTTPSLSLYHNSSVQSPCLLFKGKSANSTAWLKKSFKLESILILAKKMGCSLPSPLFFGTFWHDPQHKDMQFNSVWYMEVKWQGVFGHDRNDILHGGVGCKCTMCEMLSVFCLSCLS